jgi:septal ring factor EnvC (AmiA/AmiB activator)
MTGRGRGGGRSRAARALFVAPALGLAVLLLPWFTAPAAAQQPTAEQRLRSQREELDRIRRERADLEQRMAELRSNVHDLSEEVTNLDRRAEATRRIVVELDRQLASIDADVDSASANLARAQQEMDVKRNVMQRRLADIYKRGPTFTFQALLSARSFGELVARYKYLHVLALRDRALVRRVEQLHARVARERKQLLFLQNAVEDTRKDRQMETERLLSLERERAANLVRARRTAEQTAARLARLRRTEAELTNTIASFEAERRRAETGRPSVAKAGSSIKTGDYGNLDWPVDGPLLYSYGKAQTASNSTIRWNGVGIKATTGTPVHSVAQGRVVSVGQLGTYGLTVIIEHGGGDYSIYGSLAQTDVQLHQAVSKGQTIGAVGISDPDLPAHLHFEIRHGGPAVDPATWLRGER